VLIDAILMNLSLRIRYTVCAAVCAWLLVLPAQAQGTFVAPAGWANTEGNDSSQTPFAPGGNPSFRLQEIVPPAATPALPEAGVLLTGIAFRNDSSLFFAGVAKLNFVTIILSTSQKAFSFTFEENHGSDRTEVFSSGPLQMSRNISTVQPAPFDIKFAFQKPFFYQAGKGNLVIDISSQSELGGGFILDATHDLNVLSLVTGSGTPVGFPFDRDLVAQFDYIAVPEPSCLCLILFGNGLGAVLFKRSRLSGGKNLS
jgi:hypothetical protein